LIKGHSICLLAQCMWNSWKVSYLLTKVIFNMPLLDRTGPSTYIKESIFYFPISLDHNTVEMIPDPSWTLVKFGSNLN